MKLLVAGFPRDELDRLSAELRAEGHQVLGATGKTAAQTFARVTTVEAIVVPEGPVGDEALTWVGDHDLIVERRRLGASVFEPELLDAEPEPAPDPPPKPLAEPAPEAPSQSLAAPGSPAGPRSAAGAGAPAASQAPQMSAKLAQVRFSDYLTVLEVPPGATSFEVRDKYRQLSHLYSPQGWPGPLRPEDLRVLEEIGRGLRDALAIMGDDTLRGRYVDALTRARAMARSGG